jgi:hypothetical protein
LVSGIFFLVEPGSFDDRRIICSRKSSASGEKGVKGKEKGVRNCKHGFKLQFSSSVDIKNVRGGL